MKKVSVKTKNSPNEEFFKVDELEQKKAEKVSEGLLKPVKEIEREEKSGAVVVSDVKTDFSPSASTMDDMFKSQMNVEEGVGNVLQTLTKPQNITHFTELTDAELKSVSSLLACNNSSVISAFVSNLKEHRISKDRKSRGELIAIVQAMLGRPKEENTIDRLLKGVTMR